ncbi:MAG: RNA polymerase sigma factor [Crocinitomicaceae bacterium]|nr:RNA polymerase sigma factor [Crocinitomicaceae bacterium]MBK8926852.1 RNA polymerase sigma factor [Crocinitomicaceae bacterium]
MMKGICLRYASNETEAEDVLQEAFIRVFKNLNNWSGEGPLGAWIRRITVNMALEQYRKNKTQKNLAIVYDMKDSNPLVDDNAIEKLKLDDLLQKIQKLPTGFRTVFNLYAVEGYNHIEIGEMLGISEGTSKSQYSRARVLLRQMIEEDFKNDNQGMNYAN